MNRQIKHWKKYSQYIYLSKHLCLEYVRNFYKPIMKKQSIILKDEKNSSDNLQMEI